MSEKEKKNEQVEETKVALGFIMDMVNTGALQTLKSIKTSLVNIKRVVTLQEAVNKEAEAYQKAINEYIIQNGVGEGDNKRIDTSNPAVRNAYVRHVIALRNDLSDIEKLTKPIFTMEDLEEKQIELTTDEAILFKEFGILEVDFEIESEKTEEEKAEEEVDKEPKAS